MDETGFILYHNELLHVNRNGLRVIFVSGKHGAVTEFFARNRTFIVMGLMALIIAGTADLFAGVLQDQIDQEKFLFAGMMILIYSAIGMRGNIFGAMGSRIGTAMNMGTFEMSFRKGTVLRANVDSTIILTLIMSIAMGCTTWIVATLFFEGTRSLWDFIFISTVGGVIAGILVLITNIIITYIGSKRDWDVDSIHAPLTAAIGDVVTMPMIFAVTWLVLKMETDIRHSELIIEIISLALILLTVVYTYHVVTRKINKRDFSGEAKRIIEQSLPVLLMCLIFEIGAGTIIQQQQDSLVTYAVLLIMLPAFLNQGNALSGTLTSRLSSMIHLGTLEPTMIPRKPAFESFWAIYVCAVLTFTYIGLLSYGTSSIISDNNGLDFLTSMAIILIAGVLATTILNFLSYYVAILATRFGLDPDDHCIPITSSVMDLLGSMTLMMVIGLFM